MPGIENELAALAGDHGPVGGPVDLVGLCLAGLVADKRAKPFRRRGLVRAARARDVFDRRRSHRQP
jgi:hypothetical protein